VKCLDLAGDRLGIKTFHVAACELVQGTAHVDFNELAATDALTRLGPCQRIRGMAAVINGGAVLDEQRGERTRFRPILISRSSRLNPSPLERWVRTSRRRALRRGPRALSSGPSRSAIVLFRTGKTGEPHGESLVQRISFLGG